MSPGARAWVRAKPPAMRLHLLASLLLAPSPLACASAGAVAPAPVALEPTTPTMVFLETAGMELTPPSSCDSVVASTALSEAVYGEPESVRPACESACRVDTCRNMAVQAEVMGTMYYDDLAAALPQIIEHCQQTADACVGVSGVVMMGESLDSLGIELPEYEYEESGLTVVHAAPADRAASESACENGDAAACYALVDLDTVLEGWEEWQQPIREVSLMRWQQACDLEPMVYCRGLDLAIDYTTDEGCGG
jgi:hypothetical protein